MVHLAHSRRCKNNFDGVRQNPLAQCQNVFDIATMDSRPNLFDRWPSMADDLGYSRQRIHYWRKTRRIPAGDEQKKVLTRAVELGLDVTSEDVMFPFPEDRLVS